MKRQPEREQLNRLTVKTLDQAFIMRVKERLGCSQFEAEALIGLVKEVYFPWLSQPEAIQAGQLAMTAVSADEPGHKPLSKRKMVPVVLTLYAGEEDHRYRLIRGQRAQSPCISGRLSAWPTRRCKDARADKICETRSSGRRFHNS